MSQMFTFAVHFFCPLVLASQHQKTLSMAGLPMATYCSEARPNVLRFT